uniref:CRAL-TRIO domain-containing protein n=1 Tax=Megaselia scalaris TaxID=36166 RepID=T1GTB0_MEGSC
MTPQIETGVVKFDDNQAGYIDLGTGKIRLEKEEPAEWAVEIARKELRETPENVEKAIAELKELLQQQKHLYVPLDDDYMKMFLRPCHFYPEGALKRLVNFYHMKLKYKDSCEDILPASLKHVFAEGILTLFPKRDQHGRRILCLEAGKKWKPSKVPLNDIFKGIQLTVMGAMAEPTSQICGAVVIIDMEGLPLSHITQFTPGFAIMLLDYVQECICLRLKGVHVPFIKEKLRKRIFFHGKDFNSLAKHIDRSCLPAKYGGNMECELPPGPALGDFFDCYRKDFEMANSFGFTKDYVYKK